jgi:ribosomal protein S27AE
MTLVTVKTFDNYFSANIILTKLHAAGVECYLKDEYTVTLDPILSNAIGGIKLVVKKSDEAMVKQLLDDYESEYIRAATCPKCGSNDFAYIIKPGATNYLTAIFTWIFSSYAIAPEYMYQCGKCGYESERLPETFIKEPIDQN